MLLRIGGMAEQIVSTRFARKRTYKLLRKVDFHSQDADIFRSL